MLTSIFALLAGLAVKHFMVDFYLQTQTQIEHKGLYGDWLGISHSVEHGLGTLLVFALMGLDLETSLILGLIDLVTHYHIDYVKMRWGTRDMYTKRFWTEFGLDQLAHTLTYIELVYLAI